MRQKNLAKLGDRSLDTDSPQGWQQPQKVRVIAWFAILLQLLFPLSLSFTPAIAALSAAQSTSVTTPTFPYVLGVGENVNTIAKKHGLSLTELKNLNRYRTFAKPFAKLTAGDEIDIPTNLSPFSVDHQPSASLEAHLSPFAADRPAQASLEAKLAGYAVTAAGLLSSENAAKSAEQLAISTATSELNSSAQRWLNQFGTARVQLSVNDKFQLENSSIDVLLPLFDDETNLLFTQLGTRYKDDRTTLNAGVGFRLFQHGWMYGVNSFYDDDITGHNRRVGIGAEVWTDYLRLSANSYLALSEWRQSRDYADYNERPANGYDVRAEAYLPVYPQLGGKLMFEQYYGDEVALFGKDNRQKDPYAFTAGVSYTPVPLVTLSAEHRAGKSGSSDSSFNLQFNYRFGESWKTQIDPSAVAASRKLAGSRHDLVERNNNIVLDYQKRELIRLSLPEQISGESTTTVTVNAEVTTKYPLNRIEWDSSALAAAGGQFTQVTPQTVNIKLPAYQQTNSTNLYTLSAVAYDSQGNSSSRASMLINVMPSLATINEGNLTLDATDVVSDGTTSAIVQALVTNLENEPVAEQEVTFTADNGASVDTVVGMGDSVGIAAASITNTKVVITGADGIARVAITNTRAGITHVTATVNGKSTSVDVNFIADSGNLDAEQSTMTAEPSILVAGGDDTSLITLHLKDAHGNSVSGQAVRFNSPVADHSISDITEVGDGKYTAHFSGTTGGVVSIETRVGADVDGFSMISKPLTLVGDASKIDVAASSLTASSASIVADNAEEATISFVLRDTNSNPIRDQAVTFIKSGPTNTTLSEVTFERGAYIATLKGTAAGKVSIKVQLNGEDFEVEPIEVNLTANKDKLDKNLSQLSASKSEIPADDSTTSSISFTLKDENGNLVGGQNVIFISSLDNVTFTTPEEENPGIYTTALSGTLAGEAQITVKVNGVILEVNELKINLAPDTAHLSDATATLEATKTEIVADNTDSTLISVMLKDKFGNPISGQTVVLSTTLANVSFSAPEDNGNGVYTSTLKGLKAGTATINVKVNNVAPIIDGDFNIKLKGDATHLDRTLSSLEATKTGIKANNSDSTTISFKLKDQNGNLVSDQTVAFIKSELAGVTLGEVTVVNDVYQATLKGEESGTVAISVQVNGNDFAVTPVNIALIGEKNADNSTLSVSETSIVADGLAVSTISLDLRDGNNKPIPGETVSFVSAPDNVTFGAVAENPAGLYKATVKGTVAGAKSISVKIGGVTFTDIGSKTVTLTPNLEDLSLSKSKLAVAPAQIVADGTAVSTITFTLKDGNGNLAKGQTVIFNKSESIVTTLSEVAESSEQEGVYTATLKGVKAGTVTISVKVNGEDFNLAQTPYPLAIKLIGDATNKDTGKSELTISKTEIAAGATGRSGATVYLALNDKNDNPISGQTVNFVSTQSDVTFGTVTESSVGVYQASVSGTIAGQKTISVKVGGTSFAVSNVGFAVMPDVNSATLTSGNLTVTQNYMLADGKLQNKVQAKIVDDYGNHIAGETVAFSVEGDLTISLSNGGVTNSTGIVTGTLSSNVAGSYTVTARYGEDTQRVSVQFTNYSSMDSVENPSEVSFSATSGFPTIGFTGAYFTLGASSSLANDKFKWVTDQPNWTTVVNGKVTLTGAPSAEQKSVTISAISLNGGSGAKYSFVIAKWFSVAAKNASNVTEDSVNAMCTGNTRPPAITELTNATADKTEATKARLGSLYGEWQAQTASAGLTISNIWSATQRDDGVNYYTYLDPGWRVPYEGVAKPSVTIACVTEY